MDLRLQSSVEVGAGIGARRRRRVSHERFYRLRRVLIEDRSSAPATRASPRKMTNGRLFIHRRLSSVWDWIPQIQGSGLEAGQKRQIEWNSIHAAHEDDRSLASHNQSRRHTCHKPLHQWHIVETPSRLGVSNQEYQLGAPSGSIKGYRRDGLKKCSSRATAAMRVANVPLTVRGFRVCSSVRRSRHPAVCNRRALPGAASDVTVLRNAGVVTSHVWGLAQITPVKPGVYSGVRRG
jgi:hypothetical protein